MVKLPEGWIEQEKKMFVECDVPPPRSWNAFVKEHNKKGKVIQIAAQFAAQEFAFPFYIFRRGQRLIFVPEPSNIFLLVSWAGPIQLFKGMQIDEGST